MRKAMRMRGRGNVTRVTMVEVAGKMLQAVEIECEGCGAKDHLHGTALPDQVARKKFTQRGWNTSGKKVKCPACVRKARPKAEPEIEVARQPQVSAPPVVEKKETPDVTKYVDTDKSKGTPVSGPVVVEREQRFGREVEVPEMDAPTKRRIFREIDGNWDESRGRYMGGVTDNTIAETLNVRRVWVEQVRHEAFGPNGDNDAIEEALGEAKAIEGRLNEYVDDAMKLAGRFEGELVKVKGVVAKLELIEKSLGARR